MIFELIASGLVSVKGFSYKHPVFYRQSGEEFTDAPVQLEITLFIKAAHSKEILKKKTKANKEYEMKNTVNLFYLFVFLKWSLCNLKDDKIFGPDLLE